MRVKLKSAFEISENSATKIEIWGDTIDAEDIGDEAAEWISDFLGKKCRLTFSHKNRHLRKPAFREGST